VTDAAFVCEIERSYADEARRRRGTGMAPLHAHRAALAAALKATDVARYRGLDPATKGELEARLLRVWD
jgi:hypothetical protein